MDASGINLSFLVAPLTLSLTNGELKLNRVAGVGASKLDWAAFTASPPDGSCWCRRNPAASPNTT